MLFTFKQKIGRGRTRGEPASCLDFSAVEKGQLALRQELGPHSNLATVTRPEAIYQAPFSIKCYPKLSRLRLCWEVSLSGSIFLKSTEMK